MKVALVQNAPKLSRANLDEALALVKKHSESDVVVFGELALSGYMLQDKLYEDAWRLDELGALIAQSQEVDIAIGCALREDSGHIYNAALYLSGGKVAHIHKKLHLPNYGMFEEARYFFRGEKIESFTSRFGTSVMVICEDMWRADTLSRIAVLKPDIIFLHVASPARDFRDDSMLIESQWDALAKSAAILCSAYVLFVNRVGFEDGIGFWGGSRVITPRGEVEYRLENFQEDVLNVTLNAHLHNVQKYIAKKD